MLTVSDVKEVFTAMCASIKALAGAKADGKIDLADIGQLMVVLPTLTAAYEGIENVPAQIKDMDAAEKAELIAHVDAQLGEGAYESLGEDLMLAAVHTMSAVAKIQAMMPVEITVPVATEA